MRWLLVIALLSLPALADFTLLNKPGQSVDVQSKLVPGKENVVVFHADTYPVSHRMISEYAKLGQRRSDLAVLVVDINQLGSPLAKQYGIKEVPYVKIYDKTGKLRDEGVSAYQQTLKMIDGH